MGITVKINMEYLRGRLDHMAEIDEKTRLYAHQRLAFYLEPYEPMETGMLASNCTIEPDGITYRVPYAHYLYEGEVYGPNIPVKDESGNITGYFSPPGQRKKPTGRSLTYSKEVHPLATDHWDRAAMAARMDDLLEDIALYIETDGGKYK